jgi:hypothetical protein
MINKTFILSLQRQIRKYALIYTIVSCAYLFTRDAKDPYILIQAVLVGWLLIDLFLSAIKSYLYFKKKNRIIKLTKTKLTCAP